MDKDGDSPFGHHDVWFARQAFGMEGVSESFCVECFTDEDFRLGILALNPGHHAATRRLINNVNHVLPLGAYSMWRDDASSVAET